jgi:nucleoside-diphosphate-sugar epimerase
MIVHDHIRTIDLFGARVPKRVRAKIQLPPQGRQKAWLTRDIIALPADDPKRQPDITLAKEKLGWEPRVQLREGNQKTLRYLAKLYAWDYGGEL